MVQGGYEAEVLDLFGTHHTYTATQKRENTYLKVPREQLADLMQRIFNEVEAPYQQMMKRGDIRFISPTEMSCHPFIAIAAFILEEERTQKGKGKTLGLGGLKKTYPAIFGIAN